MHNFRQVMREQEAGQPLRGIVELDDAYLGGETSGTSGRRRGRGRGQHDALSGRDAVERRRESRTAAIKPVERLPEAGGGSVPTPTVAAGDSGGKGSSETPGLSGANTLLNNVKRATGGTYIGYSSRYTGKLPSRMRLPFQQALSVNLALRLADLALRTPPLPYRLATVARTAG